MENTAFEVDPEKGGVELSDVKMSDSQNSTMHLAQQPHLCQPDLCRSMHAQYLQEKTKMAESPWDRLKTVFLVGIIALLTLWLLVYIASSRLGLV